VSFAEGYSIILTCDERDHDRMLPRNHEAFGDNKTEARKVAKRDGWRVDWKNFEAICPFCAQRLNLGSKRHG
jgi:hypothetical protein